MPTQTAQSTFDSGPELWLNPDEYTTIEQIGDIFLVGEEHGNKNSRQLIERLLDERQPDAIGYEMPPGNRPASSGMRAALQHAQQRPDVPAIAVDIGERDEMWREVLSSSEHRGELLRDANRFTYPITDNGNLNPQAIHDASNRIRNWWSDNVWRAMYPRREAVMARVLKKMEREYGEVLCVIGAFHIQRLAQILNYINDPGGAISNQRIIEDGR